MAAFDAAGMLQYVSTMVGSLTTGPTVMQHVYIGVPESIDSRVSAYVTMGDLSPRPQATQVARREPQVMVTFAYRVAGAEQTAELQICGLVDALTAAVYADRTLGGTSQNATLDMSLNRQPEYMAIAVSEYRRYVVVITGLQTTSTP